MQELLELLERWHGAWVSVRIIVAPDELVAVFTGRLGARSDAKHPALFWPLDASGPHTVEQPGIYLHPELYEGAEIHPGEFVAEYRQSGATVNLRRLEAE